MYTSKFSLPLELEDFKRVSIAKGSDTETQFVEQLIGGIRGISLETPTTIAEVDVMAQAVADVFSKAWSDNATEKRVTRRSEPWWNDTCSETLLQYRDDKTPENWSTFRKATRVAKRKFFDAKIEEIAASAAISIYHFGQLSKRPDTSDWTVLHVGQLSKMIYYKDHKI